MVTDDDRSYIVAAKKPTGEVYFLEYHQDDSFWGHQYWQVMNKEQAYIVADDHRKVHPKDIIIIHEIVL